MTAIADELSRRIDDVQAEKERLDLAKRRAGAHTRNAKAQRLVRRLEECDANIASLLAQAADCLDALIVATSDSQTTTAGGQSSSQQPMRGGAGGADQQQQAAHLLTYEAQAQDWFATLNDVQLGLRSAVRNLQKVQQKPLATEVSTRSAGEGLAGASLGSAAKGHSLGLSPSYAFGLGASAPVSAHGSRRNSTSSVKTIGPGTTSSMTTDWHIERPRREGEQPAILNGSAAGAGHGGGSLLGAFVDVQDGKQVVRMRQDTLAEESKLSLSSLRQQERSWQQLAGALSTMASEQSDALKQIGLEPSALLTSSPSPSSEQADAQESLSRRQIQSPADVRLLRAILNLHMEVLPETTVTPLVAATSELH